MNLEIVGAGPYREWFCSCPFHVYGSPDFLELNAHKCEEVRYMLFHDSKVRAGLAVGLKGHELCSPFSAPFGGWVFPPSTSVKTVYETVDALCQFVLSSGMGMCLTLPPAFYSPDTIGKTVTALMGHPDVEMAHTDVNYHFDLETIGREGYEALLQRNAKKNLAHARRCGLTFEQVHGARGVEEAYRLIAANRHYKGYPLKMSLQDVIDTIHVVEADFFVVRQKDETVAAAQVFHVLEDVVQVIYWGGHPRHEDVRPVNFLAAELVAFYLARGVRIIDVGPSSEQGIPNFGLCSFKESIGCQASPKHTFRIKARE